MKPLLNEAQNTNTKYVELPGGHMSYIENNDSFSYNFMYFVENI